MKREYILWRIVNGHWHKIQRLDSDKYACCASREAILLVGSRPNQG